MVNKLWKTVWCKHTFSKNCYAVSASEFMTMQHCKNTTIIITIVSKHLQHFYRQQYYVVYSAEAVYKYKQQLLDNNRQIS